MFEKGAGRPASRYIHHAGQIPRGPYELRPVPLDPRAGMYELYAGDRKIGALTFAPLYDLIENWATAGSEILQQFVEMGGSHVRWVSAPRAPAAFPNNEFLDAATRIDRELIEFEFERVSGDYAYVAQQWIDAVDARERAEHVREHAILSARAELDAKLGEARFRAYDVLRERLPDVRPTQDLIQAAIDSDPSVLDAKSECATSIRAARDAEADAIRVEHFYRKVLDAIDKKASMLNMLGAAVRDRRPPQINLP